MRSHTHALAVVCAAGATVASAGAQPYVFTASSTGNTFAGNVNVVANFNGSLIGHYLTQPPPANGLLTRTITGTSGGDTAAPNNMSIGPILGNVNTAGTANTRPTGTFVLKWTPSLLRVDLHALNIDVIGTSADPTLPVNITVTNLPGFRSRDPNYTYFTIPNIIIPSLTLELGTATLTSFTIVHTAAAFATATPAGGGAYSFTMSVPARGDATFTLNGEAIPTSVPQSLTVTGTITPIDESSATATLSFNTNVVQPVPPTPADPPPLPFPVQLPNPLTFQPPYANTLMTLFFTGGNTTLTGAVTVPGGGALAPNLADLVGLGGTPGPDGQATLDDILAFIDAYNDDDLLADITGAGGPPSPPDGQMTLDDILTFIDAYNGG